MLTFVNVSKTMFKAKSYLLYSPGIKNVVYIAFVMGTNLFLIFILVNKLVVLILEHIMCSVTLL